MQRLNKITCPDPTAGSAKEARPLWLPVIPGWWSQEPGSGPLMPVLFPWPFPLLPHRAVILSRGLSRRWVSVRRTGWEGSGERSRWQDADDEGLE